MTKKDDPRWVNDPAPGFSPDGESIMVDSIDDLPPPPKIKGDDGTLYTREEWLAKCKADADMSDIDDDIPEPE